MYLKGLGLDCGVNWGFQEQPDCRKYDYLKITSLSVHERLRNDGCWVYDYSDIRMVFVSSCLDGRDNPVFYIESLTSGTRPGNLVSVFRDIFSRLQEQ